MPFPTRLGPTALLAAALGGALPMAGEILTITRMGDDYYGDAHEWWLANFAGLAWNGALAVSIPAALFLLATGARRGLAVAAAGVGALAGLPVAGFLAATGAHLPSELPAHGAGMLAYGLGMLLGLGFALTVTRNGPAARALAVGSAALWLATALWTNVRLPLLPFYLVDQPALPGGSPMVAPLNGAPAVYVLILPTLAALATALAVRRHTVRPKALAGAVVVPFVLVAAVLVLTNLFALPGYSGAVVTDAVGIIFELGLVAAVGALVAVIRRPALAETSN